MGWAVAADIVLWIAAAVLFIISYTTANFMLFLIGLGCVVLAVVLLCLMAGKTGALDSAADFTFDIFD